MLSVRAYVIYACAVASKPDEIKSLPQSQTSIIREGSVDAIHPTSYGSRSVDVK